MEPLSCFLLEALSLSLRPGTLTHQSQTQEGSSHFSGAPQGSIDEQELFSFYILIDNTATHCSGIQHHLISLKNIPHLEEQHSNPTVHPVELLTGSSSQRMSYYTFQLLPPRGTDLVGVLEFLKMVLTIKGNITSTYSLGDLESCQTSVAPR